METHPLVRLTPSLELELLPRAIGALVVLSRQGGAQTHEMRVFAASERVLASWGIACEEIEWLLKARYIARVETSAVARPPSPHGGEGPRGGESFLVITSEGNRLLKQIVAAIDLRQLGSGGDDSPRGGPSWDGRELRYDGMLLKRFQKAAPNQELLLDEFQRQGWIRSIENPLPEAGDISPGDRLRDAVKRLNRSLLKPILRFGGNGKGTGAYWRPTASPDSASPP